MLHGKCERVQYNARCMEQKPINGTTSAGKTYNISWPGDHHGGGSKPAVPVKKRIEFVADVRGENAEGKALDTAELRKRWGRMLTSDRTLFKWVKWARELVPLA